MTPTQVHFTSSDLATMLEQHALTGMWTWTFADGRQEWSEGLRRILGLNGARLSPDYGLILTLAHPEDRARLPSAAAVMQGEQVSNVIFRIIRPDGMERTLSTTISVHFSPEGRPLAASALIVNTADRDKINKLQAAEQRTRATLYRISHVATFSMKPNLLHDFSSEVADVHGSELLEINSDPFMMIVPEERLAFREKAWLSHAENNTFQGVAHEKLANGDTVQFRVIGIPIWGQDGSWIGRTGIKYPVRGITPSVTGDMRQALESLVTNHHLRAARALLGWSMSELAQASRLSLSTVRRLEGVGDQPKDMSRHRAISALRQVGIRFFALDDGSIAVAKS